MPHIILTIFLHKSNIIVKILIKNLSIMKKNKILQIWVLGISAFWIMNISNNLYQNNDLKLLNTSYADDDENEDSEDYSNFLDDILSTNDNTWSIETISSTWTINKAITTSKLFKAPNSKVYSIIDDWNTVRVKKWDWTYAKKDFSTYNDAVAYLNQNAIPAPETYKAPNGKNYTIMFENGKVVIKKSDWSYAAKTFTNYADARTYLDINAPKAIIKKVVATKKVSSTVKTTSVNSNITKKVTTSTSSTSTAKTSIPTPKIDTTTKAS